MSVILIVPSLQTYVMSRAVIEQNDCHAESPAGRVQCFKVAKIDPVSPFYPTLWLQEVNEPLGCKYLLLWVSKLEVFTQLPQAYHENSWTSMVSCKRFPSITQANSQVCFKWMCKCVIKIAWRHFGVLPRVKLCHLRHLSFCPFISVQQALLLPWKYLLVDET